MFITPKKRLMSITNALATHKYNAYSTTIDLDKAKVEEDGTILAGSPYPFNNKVEFPHKNYILDTQYRNSEFIHLSYNSGASYRNKYYTHFSIIHPNNSNIVSEDTYEDGKMKIKITSRDGQDVLYQLIILHDLTEPVRLNEKYTRTINFDIKQKSTVVLGYSANNGRHANGSAFTSVVHQQNLGDLNPGKYSRSYTNQSLTNEIIYTPYLSFSNFVGGTDAHYFEISELSIYKGEQTLPYYPAVEDFPVGTGEVAKGLMFDDINVKEQQEKGISVITGKLITSGYVLEDRLPYPIDEASKENLKMIRFR